MSDGNKTIGIILKPCGFNRDTRLETWSTDSTTWVIKPIGFASIFFWIFLKSGFAGKDKKRSIFLSSSNSFKCFTTWLGIKLESFVLSGDASPFRIKTPFTPSVIASLTIFSISVISLSLTRTLIVIFISGKFFLIDLLATSGEILFVPKTESVIWMPSQFLFISDILSFNFSSKFLRSSSDRVLSFGNLGGFTS